MTATWAQFVRDRLDEWQQAALVTCSVFEDRKVHPWRPDHAAIFGADFRMAEARSASVSLHIALNDPVFVFGAVAAIRSILTEHRIGSDPCDAHDADSRSIECDTVRLLAAFWSSHPAYAELAGSEA